MKTDIPDNIDRHEAQKAANGLLGAFNWSATSEGREFWYDVYRRLCFITEAATNENARINSAGSSDNGNG